MDIMIVIGLVEIAVIIWYILAKKNPQKYAPFLRAPYGKKRGLICLGVLFICGLIGMAAAPPAPSSAPAQQQEASPPEKQDAAPETPKDSVEMDAYKKFVALPMGSDYNTVRNALGVDGELKHENQVGDTKTQAYQFRVGSAVAMMTFQRGQLTNKAMDSLTFYRQNGESITMDQFNRVQTGMTYDQVKDIFGRHGLLKSETNIGGHDSRLMSWINSDGSNVIITFSQGTVSSKTQTRLK